MRTSDPNIWAVGDAVQVRHFVSGRPALIALAGPANKQGRIAADNVCGIPSVFTGSQGSSVIRLFDLTAASTGLNEKAARAAGLPYDKVITYSLSHAGYYPGATNMTVKVPLPAGEREDPGRPDRGL
jgi:NADPH-dependent 2,4-dienoyl-CoA reductase/sulfur reductase-like enzyme